MLITLDTTRADRLGAYGYRKPTSPRFDALVVKPAEVAPIARVEAGRTQLVDVFRWLLEAADVPVPDGTPEPRHPVLAEVHSLSRDDPPHTRVGFAEDDELHLREGAPTLLFDVARDP